jgi:hypothetical protein
MSMPLEIAMDHPVRRRAVRLFIEKGSMATPVVAGRLGLHLAETAYHLRVLARVDVLSVELGEKGDHVYAENLDECPPWVREAIEASDGPAGQEGLRHEP